MAWHSLITSRNKKKVFEREIKERNKNLDENLHDLKEDE